MLRLALRKAFARTPKKEKLVKALDMSDTEMNGGVDLPTGSTASTTELADNMTAVSLAESRKNISVNRANPFSFDLGNLLANDPNPVPREASEDILQSNARDAAQALINQLLSTCEIKSSSDGLHLVLPQPTTPLPREKPVPKEKEPTKWELFAKKKGIKDKKREGKMVYDEASGDWVPKWGYKGKNKDGDNEWLVEVDEKKESETGEAHNKRADDRRARKERVRRNERKARANDRNTKRHG